MKKGKIAGSMILLWLLAVPCFLSAQNAKSFLGKWDIMAQTEKGVYVYWLEVKMEGGKLAGNFLNRGGSVFPLPEIGVQKNELVFAYGADPKNPEKPKQVHRATVKGKQLLGVLDTGKEKISWVGVRPPKWKVYNANASHTYGTPIELFDGKSLTGWSLQYPSKPSGWTVVDGVVQNIPSANNIVSHQKFQNFKIQCEYKLEPKSNSGIYLRGRYELQVLDDAGSPVEKHGHMSVYSRVAPASNASKPAGEWQSMEAILVGNRVTVTLNGVKVQDNVVLEGITGGALDANEGEPGPIMIQGDHGRIWIRRATITPIL
jgi:hypothetical protein